MTWHDLLAVKPNSLADSQRCGWSNWGRRGLRLPTLLMMLTCLPSALAQSSASIKGIVTDPSGAPVSAARGTAENTGTGGVGSTTTGISNSTTGNNCAVSGNRPQQNLFLLNGVEFTGAAENNMQPGGTSGMLLGVDAVREFNVQRDSYGAEFGKRPGGQVVIVTQSGTTQWHGTAFEVLRNNMLH